jgi:NADH:ubiquinone oxidoreductase subunit D
MDKALRGQGCIMKRQKKSGGGAMRDMPENLKEYLEDKKVNKNVDQKKRSIDNLRSIIEDKTILINREKVRRNPKYK